MTDETQTEANDPTSIIAQVLTETRDSVDTEQAIAERIVATLADAGVVCTASETEESA